MSDEVALEELIENVRAARAAMNAGHMTFEALEGKWCDAWDEWDAAGGFRATDETDELRALRLQVVETNDRRAAAGRAFNRAREAAAEALERVLGVE